MGCSDQNVLRILGGGGASMMRMMMKLVLVLVVVGMTTVYSEARV